MTHPKFETVEQVIEHLKAAKETVDKLQKENPSLLIQLKPINDIPAKLIFDLYEYANKDALAKGRYIADYNQVKYSNGTLSLWCFSNLPVSCNFTSVKVKPVNDVPAQRDAYIEVEQEEAVI